MTTKSVHYDAAAWMASQGIINGYADGTFRPSRNITRGEMAKLAYNVSNPNNYEMETGWDYSGQITTVSFTDEAKSSLVKALDSWKCWERANRKIASLASYDGLPGDSISAIRL